MPRSSHASKGKSDRITLRFDQQTNDFYRRKANEAGVSVSEYCRQKLVRGIVNDNVEQLEKRLAALLTATPNLAQNSSVTSSPTGRDFSDFLPIDLVRATFFCREILSAIAKDRNAQFVFEAQDRAELATQKLMGGDRG